MKSISLFVVLSASAILGVSEAYAFGAKKPKNEALAAPPKGRVLKKIAHIHGISAAQIFQDFSDGGQFENLLRRQYMTLLLESGRYSVLVDDDQGRAAAVLSDSGSAEIQQEPSSFLQSVTSFFSASSEGACRFPDAQFEFDGNVMSFEITSSNGVTIGFNPGVELGGIGAGFSFKAKKSSMALHLEAADPFRQRILAAADVTAKQSETTLNAWVSYMDLVKLSYDHYSKTPLAQVARNALVAGINGMNKSTDALSWSGRVLSTQEGRYALINAGEDAGVKVGDSFVVNALNPAEDPSCQGSMGTMARPGAPLAKVVVYEVGLTTSWAEVTEQLQAGDMIPGARVTIDALVPPVAAQK